MRSTLEPLKIAPTPVKPLRHTRVPYYTQWGRPEWVRRIVEENADPCGDDKWQQSGFTDPERYRFWAKRLCGITCLESTLDYWGIHHPPRSELLDEALRHGVYKLRDDGSVDGLIYRPFAEWVTATFGVNVTVLADTSIEEMAERLSETSLAIVSVSPEIRYPERVNLKRGGHLILLHGRDPSGVWFHNPSGVGDQQGDVFLSYKQFERFFARRGMILTRPACQSATMGAHLR
ncbi:C39 family peptidase [Paraburkholderia sp. 22B1P]|uniref:C39 family peptidase n=1 Tax=Paraburkholderia sp. 22B1P TaxID=3080498 RepID=UPI00309029DC|nr:C39 family peptidase [Paraburkholderia sp. 22B1P]